MSVEDSSKEENTLLSKYEIFFSLYVLHMKLKLTLFLYLYISMARIAFGESSVYYPTQRAYLM